MNHYQFDGKRLLSVVMSHSHRIISIEGPDDYRLWQQLAEKAQGTFYPKIHLPIRFIEDPTLKKDQWVVMKSRDAAKSIADYVSGMNSLVNKDWFKLMYESTWENHS